MDLGINGKWALVCGASKGLGLACAQHLSEAGANVVIVARSADALRVPMPCGRSPARGKSLRWRPM